MKTAIAAARAATTGKMTARRAVMGDAMSDARRMGKSELFSHFAERFEVKRTQARDYFDELTALAENELKRSGEFVLPGMVKLVVQKRKARMGRNPAAREDVNVRGRALRLRPSRTFFRTFAAVLRTTDPETNARAAVRHDAACS